MVDAGLLFTSHREFPPSIWGKISTFIQIVTGLVAVGTCAAAVTLPAPLIWLTAAATGWSGIHYVFRGARLLFA
jgi:phosphatidylglycerophosphate synthase